MAWVRSTARAEHVRTLTTFENAALERLRVAIAAKAEELAARARSKVKGRLATSLKVRNIDNEYAIKGVIRSPWYVARFYEIGYGGKTIQVKAHTRRVKGLDVKEKVRDAKGRMRSKTIKGKGQVKAHARVLPRIHRPYIGVALEELRGSIKAAINQAIGEAANVSRS